MPESSPNTTAAMCPAHVEQSQPCHGALEPLLDDCDSHNIITRKGTQEDATALEHRTHIRFEPGDAVRSVVGGIPRRNVDGHLATCEDIGSCLIERIDVLRPIDLFEQGDSLRRQCMNLDHSSTFAARTRACHPTANRVGPYAGTMPGDESLQLDAERFQLREITVEDLDGVHLVFQSNPDFLGLRADPAASAGGYDLESLRRYWEGALFDAPRHLLLVADKETGKTVGLVDFVDESPADGMPWIGLLLIHKSHQRRGVGSAVLRAVVTHLESQGSRAVRMAIVEGNEAGLGFLLSSGWKDLGSASIPTMADGRRALLFELALPIADSG